MPKKSRRRSRQKSVEHTDSDPVKLFRWSQAEKDWILSTFPNGGTQWMDMSRQFEAHFGWTRKPIHILAVCIRALNWNSFTDDWTTSQRTWLAKSQKQRMSWTQMVEPFNKEFQTQRTSEQLKTQFENMKHSLNPATPENTKHRWAQSTKGSTSEMLKIQKMLFPDSRKRQPWKSGEKDWVLQRRLEKANWNDIRAELLAKFGTLRHPSILAYKFRSLMKETHIPMRPMEYWTSHQQAWMIERAASRSTPKIDWDEMASLFEEKFGFPRTPFAIRTKYSKYIAIAAPSQDKAVIAVKATKAAKAARRQGKTSS